MYPYLLPKRLARTCVPEGFDGRFVHDDAVGLVGGVRRLKELACEQFYIVCFCIGNIRAQ
ncbi:hypothetical protein D3C87_2015820 [compost metagenome]